MGKYKALTGNEACAYAMKQVNPDVVAAYPITPHRGFTDLTANHYSYPVCPPAAGGVADRKKRTAHGLALSVNPAQSPAAMEAVSLIEHSSIVNSNK